MRRTRTQILFGTTAKNFVRNESSRNWNPLLQQQNNRAELATIAAMTDSMLGTIDWLSKHCPAEKLVDHRISTLELLQFDQQAS